MEVLSVSELEESELLSAFALVHALTPGVSLERWLDHARAARTRGGILALRGEEGALFGLLSYCERDCLRTGRTLLVENLIVFELSSASPGRKALLEAVEAVAQACGCAALRLAVGKGSAEVVAMKSQSWARHGFEADHVVLTKLLGELREIDGARGAAGLGQKHVELAHHNAAS